MGAGREKAIAFCLKWVEQILPGSPNTQILKDWFEKMSDEEFDATMKKFKTKESRPPLIAPNLSEYKLDVRRNIEIGKQLGHTFFQHVWMPSENGGPEYLSPIPYLVVELPIRRQAQLLEKKISIPEHNKSVDDLTGQPTGASKGSKLSYPEIQIMAAKELDDPILELIKYRGGDQKGFNAMNKSVTKTGTVSLKAIEHEAGGVKSTRTLRTFLLSMHLTNTLPV